MFTKDSLMGDVLKEPLLASEFDKIFGSDFRAQPTAPISGWWEEGAGDPVKSVHGGMNALLENIQNGVKVILPLWDEEEIKQDESRKNTALYFFPAKEKAPFALICPGGGYGMVCTPKEGFPIATALNQLGLSAFVLVYRVGKDGRYPAPQDDLAKAVRTVLRNADELNVMRENYSVWGFSAGGHLAASFGTPNMGYKKYGLPGPKAMVLSYPVITMLEKTHGGSQGNLLGPNPTEEEKQFASVQLHIDRHYPCTYIWTCLGDGSVPFENSRGLKENLSQAGVRHRLKVVQGTAHGWGLGTGTPADGWFPEAVAFWRSTMV